MYSSRSNSSVRTSTWRIPWAWANSRAAARSRSGKLAETSVTARACSPSTSWATAAGRAESARRRKALIKRSSSRSRAKRRCSGSVIEFPQPVGPSASSWRNKIAASGSHLAPSGLVRHYTLAEGQYICQKRYDVWSAGLFGSASGDELVTIGNFLAAIRYQLTAWPLSSLPLHGPAASRSLKSRLNYKILGPKNLLRVLKGNYLLDREMIPLGRDGPSVARGAGLNRVRDADHLWHRLIVVLRPSGWIQ